MSSFRDAMFGGDYPPIMMVGMLVITLILWYGFFRFYAHDDLVVAEQCTAAEPPGNYGPAKQEDEA